MSIRPIYSPPPPLDGPSAGVVPQPRDLPQPEPEAAVEPEPAPQAPAEDDATPRA